VTIAQIQVRNGLRDALAVAPAVADVLMVGKYRPLAETEATGVVLRLERSLQDEPLLADAPETWTTQLALDVYVRAAGTDDPEEAAGPVLAAVYQRLREVELAHLGVNAVLPSTELQFGLVDADPNVVGVSVFVTVQHETNARTLDPRN
jgi:hypothetical protein